MGAAITKPLSVHIKVILDESYIFNNIRKRNINTI